MSQVRALRPSVVKSNCSLRTENLAKANAASTTRTSSCRVGAGGIPERRQARPTSLPSCCSGEPFSTWAQAGGKLRGPGDRKLHPVKPAASMPDTLALYALHEGRGKSPQGAFPPGHGREGTIVPPKWVKANPEIDPAGAKSPRRGGRGDRKGSLSPVRLGGQDQVRLAPCPVMRKRRPVSQPHPKPALRDCRHVPSPSNWDHRRDQRRRFCARLAMPGTESFESAEWGRQKNRSQTRAWQKHVRGFVANLKELFIHSQPPSTAGAKFRV